MKTLFGKQRHDPAAKPEDPPTSARPPTPTSTPTPRQIVDLFIADMDRLWKKQVPNAADLWKVQGE